MEPIKLNALAVKMVIPFMATNDIRYYLNGVSVRSSPSNGAVIAATDGHKVLAVHDENVKCSEKCDLIIKINKDAVKFLKPDHHIIIDGQTLSITDRNCQVVYIQPGDCLIDGKFPRYEGLLNLAEFQLGFAGGFFLENIKAVMQLCTLPHVTFEFYHSIEKLEVERSVFMGCQAQHSRLPFIGAVMPVRQSERTIEFPNWLPSN